LRLKQPPRLDNRPTSPPPLSTAGRTTKTSGKQGRTDNREPLARKVQMTPSTIAALPAGVDRTVSRRQELKGIPMAPAEAIDERDEQLAANDLSREEQDGAQ